MNAPRLPTLLLKNTKNDIYQQKDNIKQYLLQMGGFKNIQEAKKVLGVTNIRDVYEPLLEDWNNFVESENKNLMKKYNEEYKLYQKEKLRLYNEKVKREVRQKLIKQEIKKQEQKKKRQEKKINKTDNDKKKKDITKGELVKYIQNNIFVYSSGSSQYLLHGFFKQFLGKDIIVDVVSDYNVYSKDHSGEDKVVETFQHKIPETNRDYNHWFKGTAEFTYFYPEDTAVFPSYPGCMLLIHVAKTMDNINYLGYYQIFQDSDNGKCVFNPIRLWATDKYDNAIIKKSNDGRKRYNKILKDLDVLETKYINGVDENNINDVCNTLQIDIVIEKPLCDIKFIECKSIKKALKKFSYVNTRLNHIEAMLNEYVLNDKPISISRADLRELKKQLDTDNIYYTFNRDNLGLSKINTISNTYSLKNDMADAFNEFEFENNLINCKIDDIDDANLSRFIHNGTHYNGTIDFKNVEDYKVNNIFHIDMKKAYAKFYECKFYEGFLGKITDFRTTDKMEGVGLYLIINLVIPESKFKMYNDKLNIYNSNNIYTSFELTFLLSVGCSFNIVGGVWGVNPLDFRFNEKMLDGKTEEGNSYYAIWCGKCDSHYLQSKTWINGDENFAMVLKENSSGNIQTYDNNEICIKYDKKHNYHLGHITSFITAYQRLNVLEQLLLIDYDNVIRVCVDGIYTVTEISNCVNAFRHKNEIEEKTFVNIAGDSYISNLIRIGEDDESDIFQGMFNGESRRHNKKELHIGAGGNGKTHKNLTDKGLTKLLYVSPSWKLARNKQKEYGCNVSVWARLITDDPEMINYVKRHNNVLLIDEVSMLSEDQKNKIFEIYDDMKIIFCGDLGYQLSTFTGQEMNSSGFDEIIQNDTNYRTNDIELLKLLNKLRVMIKDDVSCYVINSFVLQEFKKFNKIISIEELQEKYDVNDMILSGTNETKDIYTDLFKHIQKYYCKENNRLYCNGDIVIGEEPQCKNELRHAYTTHSIQGETAYNNLFIDASKMFNARMFYTALSRAKKLDQIYIISK